MSKNLVLVESPSKAKTINKYLGRDYHVEATVGHIRNLPKSKLGVDTEHNFEPQYMTIRGKGDLIKKIKSLASKSSKIFIATDPDREGEAIAQDIVDILTIPPNASVHRVLFNEITKNGVTKAMKAPRDVDGYLVSSQRARRVMDRIIGYKISPFLWKAIIETSGSSSLSAGRVQSIALKIICDREAEIEKFVTTEYWSLWAIFETDKGEKFKAKLFKVSDKELKLPPKPVMTEEEWKQFLVKHIAAGTEKEAAELFDRLKSKKDFIISNVTKKQTKRNPSAPFITSSLQAEASRRLRMRPKQTMLLAQKLYEGIDMGSEGTVGLITYMRTDSTRLSEDILSEARDYIKTTYGENYLPPTPNVYDKKKDIKVQDAHEAIRPTSLKYTPEFVKPFLDRSSYNLYELVWKRFVSSQMTQALLEVTVIEIQADEFIFKAYGTAVNFNGFMQVYEEILEATGKEDDKEEAKNETIPLGLEKDQKLKLDDLQKAQHFTKPPARFTESSLIKELESNGIGRPSTYSMIVSTIQDRKYVDMIERKLNPTILGKKVNEVLVKNFSDIIAVDFTARMEGELDLIAQGERDYVSVLNEFYSPFAEALKKVEDNIEKISCDLCGHEMIMKMGRFGKFLACSNYPDCKNIKSFKDIYQQNQEPEYTGETCEKCGSRTVFRNGKFGRFIGCEKYPECDYVKNITLDVKCPKCKDGDVVERKSKRNKLFYGCSKYPNCDFVAWYKPIPEPCPEGDSPYMEQRYSVKKGNYLRCPVCSAEVTKKEPEAEVEEDE
jgi:DNA topoisomerase I